MSISNLPRELVQLALPISALNNASRTCKVIQASITDDMWCAVAKRMLMKMASHHMNAIGIRETTEAHTFFHKDFDMFCKLGTMSLAYSKQMVLNCARVPEIIHVDTYKREILLVIEAICNDDFDSLKIYVKDNPRLIFTPVQLWQDFPFVWAKEKLFGIHTISHTTMQHPTSIRTATRKGCTILHGNDIRITTPLPLLYLALLLQNNMGKKLETTTSLETRIRNYQNMHYQFMHESMQRRLLENRSLLI